jgi:hypothetical protein
MAKQAKSTKQPIKWEEVIQFTEEKIRRTDLKSEQLRALVRRFRARQAAGEPSPFEVAAYRAEPRKRAGF